MQSLKVEMDQGEEPVSTSVSSASYYLRPWPSRWSRAQPAALAGEHCAERTGSSCEKLHAQSEQSYPSKKLLPTPTECEHLSSGICPEARRAKWAHVGWAPWFRCADKVGRPCAGGPDSICDPEPEHWEWDLDEAGGYCPSVPEPPLSLLPSRGSLCKGLRLSHCVLPWKSPHRMRLAHCLSIVQNSWSRLIRASISSHVAWNLCALAAPQHFMAQEPAAAILQCRRQPSRGKSMFRNGAAARGV